MASDKIHICVRLTFDAFKYFCGINLCGRNKLDKILNFLKVSENKIYFIL